MISLPYGNSNIRFDLPANFCSSPKIFFPNTGGIQPLKQQQIERIIVSNDLKQRITANTKVSIAVNDPTRPIPNKLILPPLLDYLHTQGIVKKNVTLFIASGTHEAPTKNELAAIIPVHILQQYRTIVHDCDDVSNLLFLGDSSAGTPIYINKDFYHSDLKIVTGHIEPHHFMGYSGGVKSAVIGLGGRKTIEKNHRMLNHPDAKMGKFLSNPMRADLEEIGRNIGIDLALNVILDDKKQILRLYFDQPLEVMKKGIAFSKKLTHIDTNCFFDLVICSAGGYPKDINLYQAQKAITHACSFLRKGGIVIITAECREGFGSEPFRSFMEKHQSPQEIISAFKDIPFCIGPHKAYQLALQAREHQIILVSEVLKEKIHRSAFLRVNRIEEGLEICQQNLDRDAKIAILPYATHIINQNH